MAFQTILFESADGVARLTLDRPDRLNSLNRIMLVEIREAFERIKNDSAIRALLVTGNGRAFCAGQDLQEGEALDSPEAVGDLLHKFYNPMIGELRSLGLPVIAAVNGVAAGAGCSLALACDIVLAARSASFSQAFCRVGLIPDAGGSFFLPRLVGPARALGLTLLGEPLPAETAEAWGLIWRCLPDESLAPEADALARRLSTQATRALALTKRAIDAAADHDLDQQLGLEADLQAKAADTADFREGRTAFLEKRQPRFTGH
jgi:2-(1,2-epoxy-1,2-dihydrophenyl)acetyl-CoA isomerase